MARDVQLEGDLVSTPVEAVLRSLHDGRVTGTVWLEGHGFAKRLFVENGTLIAAASSDPREFLGAYLVGWGLVSASELDRLVEQQDHYHTLVGELMVRNHRVDGAILDHVLRVVACEVALSTFLWREGRYRVELCRLPGSSLRPIAVPLAEIVAAGLERRRRWPAMREVVPNPRLRPRLLRPKALNLLDRAAAAILGACDGEHSLSDLARVCHEPTFAVWETVSHAASQGIVDLLPARDDDSGDEPETAFGTVRSLAERVEESLARGELRVAVATISLLARRFRAAADIAVIIAALRERAAAAIGEVLGGEAMLVAPGPAASAARAGAAAALDQRLRQLADGHSSVSHVVAAVAGDQLETRAALAELVRQGVVTLYRPSGW